MTIVNIGQAKANFSKLIARVCKGEEIVLAKAGKPVAKIVPFEIAPQRRVPGHAKGLVKIFDNFDDPLSEEFLRAFEGRN